MTFKFSEVWISLAPCLAGISILAGSSPARGDIVIDSTGVSVGQGVCVSVLGGNCSMGGTNDGTFSLGQPGVLGPAPTEATYSYSNPNGGGYFSNSASANGGASFNVSSSANSATMGANLQINTFSAQNGGVSANASASADFSAVIGVSSTSSAPIYYSVSFNGPVNVNLGSTSSGSILNGLFNCPSSGPCTDSGTLPTGSYALDILAQLYGDSNTSAGLAYGGSVVGDATLELELSSSPISGPLPQPPSDPLPTPLPNTAWLMLGGLAGLGAMARRTRAAS